MLDPIIQGALILFLTTVIKVLLATYAPGLPISDELINSVATIIVTWLVALASYRAIRLAILKREAGKKLLSNGVLAEKAD